MAQVSITAEHRSDFGKGAARRTRRAGRVPAVIYGQGQELQHVSLPDHELTLARYADGELRGTTGAGNIERDGAEFVVGDISLGARVGVIVQPKDDAPVLLGPIDATAERHEVVARVVPFAEVTCRLVDAGGAQKTSS